MNLEEAVKKGLKDAKYLSLFLWGAFVAIVFIFWVVVDPNVIDNFEFIALAYIFGCSLGMTAGWDTIRGNVKKALQTSDVTGDKNE